MRTIHDYRSTSVRSSAHLVSGDLLGAPYERLRCPACNGRGHNTNNGSECASCDCGIVDSPREAIADCDLLSENDEAFWSPTKRKSAHAQFFA